MGFIFKGKYIYFYREGYVYGNLKTYIFGLGGWWKREWEDLKMFWKCKKLCRLLFIYSLSYILKI